MNRSATIAAFGALLAVQAAPPLALAVQRTGALHQGKPVTLAVETRDPRDLLRGEYSVLAYGIGNLQGVAADLPACRGVKGTLVARECGLDQGREVFVTLEEDAAGIPRAVRVSLARPSDGTVYAAGRLQGLPVVADGSGGGGADAYLTARVAYGIERWYGPQGRPAFLDRVPRGDVRVQARLGPTGVLSLDRIEVRGETFAETARLW